MLIEVFEEEVVAAEQMTKFIVEQMKKSIMGEDYIYILSAYNIWSRAHINDGCGRNYKFGWCKK